MIKLTICAVRKPGLSHEEFDTHWRDVHGPLVRSVPEFTRHLRGYIQCHGVSTDIPLGVDAPYDGIAELWFDDLTSVGRAFSEPRYLEIIRPDELKLIDFDKCVCYASEEVKVV